ncbi:MAG: alcohol dehydrogenase catalytic domain-containing protein [Vicinamibacteria bacterium]|jgi:alcohol dehydrogenase
MKQLTFVEAGKLEWRDLAEPRLEGEGEAIVKPLAVATCDLDLFLVRGVVPAAREFAFGHECVAEVVETGEGVGSFAAGDLVSVPFQLSCGECARCLRGQTGNCESVDFLSTYGLPLGPDNGGFVSDVARVPYAEAMMVAVPEGIEPAAIASLSDNIPDAWRSVGPQLDVQPGAPVLICGGAGSIPVYAAALAVAKGSERVDFVGGRPHEREAAARAGANLLDEEFPGRLGPYPITVAGSPDHEGLNCALRSTEPDGICTAVAIFFEPETPMPLLEMYTRGVRFHTGRCHARPAIEPILKLIRSGAFRPDLVTRETATWDEAAEAVAGHDGKLVISRE